MGDLGGIEGLDIKGNIANPNVGIYVTCDLPQLAVLDIPACQNVNGATFTIFAGQTDNKLGSDSQYIVDTMLTITNTTTTWAIYGIFRTSAASVPEPST